MSIFNAEMSDQEIVDGLIRIKTDAPNSEDVATAVAQDFAKSGKTYRPLGNRVAADVASTGGPTSLTTLLTPLFLRAAGLQVPKLGVPGRPAGGIDCLSQIRGYRTRLTEQAIDHALAHAGYAHFESGGEFAPLDARVFCLRQQVGAQQVPALVVASLLAKKLAVGVRRAGLDVRVLPNGNFGESWKEAKQNARFFSAVAKRLQIHPQPLLTDGRFPYQPYIGRRESILALSEIFSGQPDSWLQEHLEQSRQIAIAVAPEYCRSSIAKVSPNTLRANFLLNLEAQGANEADYVSLVRETGKGHSIELTATQDGFVAYSLSGIRDQFVIAQKKYACDADIYPDPLGLILRQRSGAWVESGQVIATLRVQQGVDSTSIAASLMPHVCATTAQPLSNTTEGL